MTSRDSLCSSGALSVKSFATNNSATFERFVDSLGGREKSRANDLASTPETALVDSSEN
jgi:hypothetical protein